MKLMIHSVYLATEGEGVHLGEPQIFIRFQGCNIGCHNCDSKDTWDFDTASELELSKIINLVSQQSQVIKRISITGGDPLHSKHLLGVNALIDYFHGQGYWINLEASGVKVVDEIFEKLDFISFDIKPPSTGVKYSLDVLFKAVENYSDKMQIKSVVADKKDLEYLYEIKHMLKLRYPNINTPFCLTPCYEPDTEFPHERFKKVLEWNARLDFPFRVIGQQHKWVYGAKSLLV